MQDKREVWHVSGSKTVLEASKARDMVVAHVPTSAVGCAARWHVERQKQLQVEFEVLRTRSSRRVLVAAWTLTRDCLSVFRGSSIVTTGHPAMCWTVVAHPRSYSHISCNISYKMSCARNVMFGDMRITPHIADARSEVWLAMPTSWS